MNRKRDKSCGNLAQPDEINQYAFGDGSHFRDCVQEHAHSNACDPFVQSDSAFKDCMEDGWAKADNQCLTEGESPMSTCLRQQGLLSHQIIKSLYDFGAGCTISTLKEFGV